MTAGPSTDPATVVVRFEAELRRFVTRRVPGPDADDVLQDALVRIWSGAPALRETDRLGPWVYRVTRSAIIDHHRRRRDLPSDTLDETPEPPVEPENDARAALAACLEPMVGWLPPEQAEALRLTDLGGLSQVEAAARLGVPLPTLKARVQRGRRRIRAAFDACCAFVQDGRGAVIAMDRRCGC